MVLKWDPVASGVPQGTILGQLLFQFNINDISVVNMSKIRLFSDNCVWYSVINNEDDTLKLHRLIERSGS